ncbi:MAG: hypothetical protein HY691_17555 [Chloroflexi bacterium]|nr:hypothetical protein [Chloroflexota bacterium]
MAALAAGLGVAAVPDTDIRRVHRLAVGSWVTRQQVAQAFGVDAAAPQGGVPATPLAPMRDLQAQVNQRRERARHQERVDYLEQGVPPPTQAAVRVAAEGAQAVERRTVYHCLTSWHNGHGTASPGSPP